MKTRLNNIFLLLVCFIFYIIRGRADRSVKINNIIVVPVGKLGDVVCTTPLLNSIRKSFSGVRIYVEDQTGINKQILEDSGLSDGYFSFGSIMSVWKDVKARNIDTACITGPSFREAAYLYIAGVPLIINSRAVGGFCPQQTKSFRLLSRLIVTVPFYFHAYAPRERLRVLEPVGIKEDNTKKILGFSESARITVQNFFKDNNFNSDTFIVVVSLAAGNKIKEWPIKKFAIVGDYLQSKNNVKVVLVGATRDLHYAERMRFEMNTKVVDTVGMWNIDELKAFISCLDMFISVDTGPIYIAEAFGVPTVDIVGPMDETEQPPTGLNNKLVIPKRTKPEIHIMNSRVYDKDEAKRQTNSITTDDVIKAIDDLMVNKYNSSAL